MDLSSIFSSALSSSLSTAIGSVRTPVATGLVPNPLHQFASYTYNFSLWWLDPADYNAIADDNIDIGTGNNYTLGPNSFVVAEQGGVYANSRMPETIGLDYNIKSVEFETIVGLNATSKSSNMTRGSMTIIEPYGVTLLDSLILHSLNSGNGSSYIGNPYMLQLDFVGYDDTGAMIPTSATNIYRKRFPINILEMKIEVTQRGTEYKLEFAAMGHTPQNNEYGVTQEDITVTASTVGDFFTQFANRVNSYWQAQVQTNKVQYADYLSFDIDSTIAASTIINKAHMNVSQANPNGDNFDISKGSFSIPRGTQFKDIIDKVICQSQFIIGQLNDSLQQSVESGNIPTDQASAFVDNFTASMTKVMNTYKLTTSTRLAGQDSSGTVSDLQFDNVRNVYAKSFRFSIHQYSSYDIKHPSGPTLTDSTPYTVKEYNYLYTGQNIDVLDLKINFDKTFYTAVNTYTDQFSATNPSASTSTDAKSATSATSTFGTWLSGILGIGPNLTKVPTLQPLRYKNIVGDQRDNTGFNIINNPSAQKSANFMRSLYTNLGGDMLNLDLTIVGDPTLLKQDDWLYNPSPTLSTIFNGSTSQSVLASQYGQIKMDDGALVARVNINTPIDIDIDYNNNGLAYPQIGTRKSFFSGQYQIRSIKNHFDDGKFTQVLSMTRCANSDYASAVSGSQTSTSGGRGSNATVSSISNLNSGAASNMSTAAGDNGLSSAAPGVNTGGLPIDSSRN
jgi:hypothetical protein